MASAVWQQFLENIRNTGWMEFIAVIAGIGSVWFSRKENILVYPIGLINTTFFVYLSLKFHLYGEASVNFYYSVMSIYGWILWSKRDRDHHHTLKITPSSGQEWFEQVLFFMVCYSFLFAVLTMLKQAFAAAAIPWADALASASAYTGMWLMAKKKIESWYWWIITNIASIPLYFVKGLAFTSFQYVILLVLAVSGLFSWQKKFKVQ
ncbi:nicotinamide riboside transporter PnuC [Flavihumibacter petaseus]|uniref:Nicotinamide riboside transporter PnuC n=1 Tax=Flavihumibacter petaseus NBRC 106054 TaxID=1220578 RepID=A0A0E9MXT5_9BACT|nr:nicotinamide riboside transporter PnuC [Flavihumibacter petaseus]GAO42246.1 putative PnuC family transporter [Flavihumibacter petaseus NBRC 106054]